jgi:hypothetical protein
MMILGGGGDGGRADELVVVVAEEGEEAYFFSLDIGALSSLNTPYTLPTVLELTPLFPAFADINVFTPPVPSSSFVFFTKNHPEHVAQ